MDTNRTHAQQDSPPDWAELAFAGSYRVFDVPPSEDCFAAELRRLAAAHAPRRFALVGVEPDRSAAEILVWGVEWPGRADTISAGARRHVFDCAEEARARVARLGPTRLVFLDPSTRRS